MSKHNVSPKDGAMSAQGDKSRRAALRALAAGFLAVPTISSMAATLPDPIFTAIARHKAAYEVALATSFAIDDLINAPEGREVSQAEWDAHDRARESEEAAFDELVAGTPETAAGMRAIIAHLIFLDDGRLSQRMRRLLGTLLNSTLLPS